MSPTTLPAVRRQAGLQGWHVLAGMLLFFGVIFAVNGVMVFEALSTNGGIVANEPYRKGLEYNRRIEASERQDLLGWSTGAALDAAGNIDVKISDSRGEPVSGLALGGTIGRPSDGRSDVTLTFSEVDRGAYRATVTPAPGTWLLSVEARPVGSSVEAPIYRMKRRLWLKP